mmetsp:Transcript_7795/g.48330  ORF Transcript_7795/g.48330 Transcript_7795/m.48330 type:complete len:752 (+) Transcript_7795:5453-7708(+)
MVKFGDVLVQSLYLPWKEHYLDYKLLKKKLKLVKAANAKGDVEEQQRKAAQFRACFDAELEKILSFYRYKEGEIKVWIDDLLADLEKCEDLTTRLSYAPNAMADVTMLESRHKQWLEFARDLIHTLRYVRLNITAFRKILKKANKHGVDGDAEQLGEAARLHIHIDHPTEASTRIQHFSNLPQEHGDELQRMQQHAYLLEVADCVPEAIDTLQQCTRQGKHAANMVLKFPQSRVGSRIRARNCIAQADRLLQDINASQEVLDELQHEIQEAGEEASLMQVTSLNLEAQAGLFVLPPTDRKAVEDMLGLVLNLMSTALYMVNYNLVTPMIDGLCARLEIPGSWGGVIIGASDITAMLATILYSVWTNKVFKPPLLFAAGCCFVGNVCYSLSFDSQSLTLLLLGRLLNGFGAARGIGRRYIADFVPKHHRTGASAAFVASSTIGMALGPILAAPLSGVRTTIGIGNAVLHLNEITLGGWVMALVWFLYAATTLFFFQEPTKAGDELAPPDPARLPRRSLNEGDLGESAPAESNDLATPLLAKKATKRKSRFRTVAAIGVCFLTLFVLKFVQQGFITSVANVGPGLFGWGADRSGVFLSSVNLSMLPVNFAVASLSYYISDRGMLLSADILGSVGCAVMLAIKGSLSVLRFTAGGVCVLAATVVMEAVSMSLMSKKLPKKYAAGTFNMGFLATEAGTLGRFAGNVASTMVGHLTGVATLPEVVHYVNIFYGTLLSVSLLCLFSAAILFSKLKTT